MKELKPQSTGPRRILVADDHPLLREGVVQLIDRQTDLTVCGQADTVTSTRVAVASKRPDLLLMDLRLGGGDGFELLKSLRAEFPALPILILSQHDETVFVQRALRAGAIGYVTKQQATAEVLQAIRAGLRGEIYLSGNLSARVLMKLMKPGGEEGKSEVDALTDRELHVLYRLGAGKAARDIAAELNVAVSTVETHRENIKQKLGLRSAQELSEFASAWLLRSEKS
jgi:DNA-binding NarL/FixJ family response regulator